MCPEEAPSYLIVRCKEFIGESFACGAGWAYWINWVGYVPAEAVACGIMMSTLS